MARTASCFVIAFLMFCRCLWATSVKQNLSLLEQVIKDDIFQRSSINKGTEPDPSRFHRHEDCDISIITRHKHVHSTLTADGHAENITLRFTAFGKQFYVDLKLTRDLFGVTYIRKLVHEKGEDFREPVHRKEHCYYQGGIPNKPASLAAVSTCDGVRGFVSDGRETYHIEPVNGPVHRIFRHSDIEPSAFFCGTDDHSGHSPAPVFTKHTRRKRSLRKPYDANKLTRFVELYLVSDYRTYNRYGKSAAVVFRRSQDIANIVNSLYRQLNIYVVLVGVEVWSTGDKISITANADTTMENFLHYRMERINPYHPNDNAQLITGISFDHGVVGKAIKGPICTHQFSGGVSMDYNGPVTLVATTVAHEMGHNFGMEHDNDTKCSCHQEKCIMAATSGHISPQHWSSCSENSLEEAFELGMDYCLRDLPAAVFDGPVCGNGLVEEGEECDCGLLEDCGNRCCNATSCRLHSKATCGAGKCCDLTTCMVKEASTRCRDARNECDLPEFCDGSSEFCPGDVYLQDGKSCKDGQSYCYKGQCHTHSGQCRLLWGDTGRVSDPLCFQHLNVWGTQDGNCGYNWTTERYHTCERENVMCGLLHCVHLNEKLMFWRDNLALTMRANFLSRGNQQYVCRSTMLDVGLDMRDPGMVPDGAKCEDEKICIKQACTPLQKLKIPQCPDCHGNGVCNSLGNCHCDVGYKPPYCDRPGYGGSINSGPATNEYAKRDLLIGLLVLFLVIVPLLVLVVIGYLNRHRITAWLKQEPRGRFSALRRSGRPPQPPRPQPSNGLAQKRWSAPSRPSPRLEISGPLLEDPAVGDGTPPGSASTNPPQRPKAPPRPIYKPSASQPPGVSFAGGLSGPPPTYSDATTVGKDGRNAAGSGGVTSSQSAAQGTPKASASQRSQPPRVLSLNTTDAKVPPGDRSPKKAAGRPSMSPPTSPARVARPVGHSQSVREPGNINQSGDHLPKRQSFRGAEISSPVLMSTTNRDSNVFSDFEVDRSGIIARPVQQHHSFHSASPATEAARDGVRSAVRRTLSDRPLSPVKPTGMGSEAEPRHGFINRPLPPEPVYEDEPVYMNEELSDLGDLEAHIASAFDGLYRNVPDEDNSATSQGPHPANQTTAVPAAGVGNTSSKPSESKHSGPPRPVLGPHVSSSATSQNPGSKARDPDPRNPAGSKARDPDPRNPAGSKSPTSSKPMSSSIAGKAHSIESKLAAGSKPQAATAGTTPKSAGRGTVSQAHINTQGLDSKQPPRVSFNKGPKPSADSKVSVERSIKPKGADAESHNTPPVSNKGGSELPGAGSSAVKQPGQGRGGRGMGVAKGVPGPGRPTVAPKPASGKPVRSYKF